MGENKKTIGVLTIGQSPRVDVTPSVQGILGDDVLIQEAGGLDRFTDDEVEQVAPIPGDTTYVSRMRNGKQVKISKSKLMPLLQEELAQLEREVSVVIMLCTGDFPDLKSTKPILYPDKILNSTVQAVMSQGKLGIIIPLAEQKDSLIKKWKHFEVIAEAATPYEESDVIGAAKRLKERGAAMIVLDCIGYNEQHKEEAIKGSGLPVILPRTLVARIAAEYL
ncbi:AroM family protein [Ornithinibacillus sp. 4-3]|uniref:AroM family protein n=1 Tax=Ornithinibacillus sp. 4-3 TaxID=3231488 RepID=A0AB39HP22_9BACI